MPLSKDIGTNSNFAKLGDHLGFDADQVAAYKTQNNTADCNGAQNMLHDWARRTAAGDQIPKMRKALEISNMGDLATKYFP